MCILYVYIMRIERVRERNAITTIVRTSIVFAVHARVAGFVFPPVYKLRIIIYISDRPINLNTACALYILSILSTSVYYNNTYAGISCIYIYIYRTIA